MLRVIFFKIEERGVVFLLVISIIEVMEEKELRGYGGRLLAKREYSPKELAEKMLKRTEDSSLVWSIINGWEESGVLSNKRYTEDFIKNQTLTTKNGPRIILEKLRLKGGDVDYGKQVMEYIFGKSERLNVIEKLMNKKSVQLEGRGYSDFATKGKIMAYIAGKGYDFDEIKEVVG